jgi:hypothetical protein
VPIATEASMRRCPKCKAEGRDGARICKEGGSILIKAAPPAELAPPVIETHLLEMPAADWRCVTCGELHSQRLPVCWRCGTDAWGKADPDFVKVELDESLRSPGLEPDPKLHPEEDLYRAVPQCERCRSSKVIVDVEIGLQVVTRGDPEALFLTRPTVGKLVGDLCGECGHVELKLKDTATFYRAHVEAREKNRGAGR